MNTIQELIDSGQVVLGKTKIAARGWPTGSWFLPSLQATNTIGAACYGLRQDGRVEHYSTNFSALDWRVYKEPVEMEDRWLWAVPNIIPKGE
tara:strand:+ start:9840 stop:10115 length:276 start_codon:yes stop_codon:yes gene_type:complete